MIRVLLVEDDSDYALTLEHILTSVKNPSFTVLIAASLAQARGIVSEHKLDVVLLDLKLPDSEGIETYTKLQSMAPDVPVVVLTGAYDGQEGALATEALKQGAQDYLVKAKIEYHVMVRALRYAIERKKAEKQLSASKAQTEHLLSSVPSILIGIDSNGLITHWNRVAERTFELHRHLVVKRKLEECKIDWDVFQILKCISDCFKSGCTSRLDDFPFKRPDGEVRYLGLTVNPANVADGDRNILIFGADVTERRRSREEKVKLEEDLQQALKMESLGTLAGGISHDFKNMLGPIMGYIEMTRRGLPKESKDYVRLGKALRCVHRVNDIVSQIVAFSRKGSGEKETIEVGDVVNEVMALLKEVIPSTIDFKPCIGANTGCISADPSQIHQVLMNLCVNASYEMKDLGGELIVEVEAVEIDDDFAAKYAHLKAGPYVKISVRDTGPGIAPDVLSRIFEPYFTTKPPGEGSGMGLAAVYGIVKQHDGEIVVSSETGKGTVFDVYFPRIEATPRAKQKPEQELPRGKENILLVDDKSEVIDSTGEMLESLGYHVVCLTDSMDALKLFQDKPELFDLVLTDQTMPKMTGVRLITKLKQTRPDIPVILYSGNGENMSLEECRNLGIQDYLPKPMSMSELATTVRHALGH